MPVTGTLFADFWFFDNPARMGGHFVLELE